MTWSSRTKLVAARSRSRRGRIGGTLTRAKRRSPVSGSRSADGDRQAERRDVRERVARIDGERRQDRVDLVEEPLAERRVVLRDVGVVDDLDALGERARRGSRVDRRLAPRRARGRAPRAAASCSAAVAAVRRQRRGPGVRPAGARPEIRTWKNSSSIAGEDRQELDPLEQRVALVARLVQDARVELEPGELAVEVRERPVDRLAGARPGSRPVGGLAPTLRSSTAVIWLVVAHCVGRLERIGPPAMRRAGEDSTRTGCRRRSVDGPSALRDVPPLAGPRVDEDPHPVAASSGRRRPRPSAGSAARSARPARRRRARSARSAARPRPSGSAAARARRRRRGMPRAAIEPQPADPGRRRPATIAARPGEHQQRCPTTTRPPRMTRPATPATRWSAAARPASGSTTTAVP